MSRIEELRCSWVSRELARQSGKRSPERRLGRKLKIGIAIFLVVATLFQISAVQTMLANGSVCNTPHTTNQATNRVALIDPLSQQFPDAEFIQRVRSVTTNAGYMFDYYPPEAATLSFFVNLPSLNYRMVILRTHGAYNLPAVTVSDPYNQQSHVTDQLFDRLAAIEYDGHVYFGLKPSFVTQSMRGCFSGTLILGMGCSEMSQTDLAKAFVQKGARAFIGWTSIVTVIHTDNAFRSLVTLLLQGNTVQGSVQSVMENFGPDPSTGAQLSYYPV